MAMYSFLPHFCVAKFCGVPSCVFDKLGCAAGVKNGRGRLYYEQILSHSSCVAKPARHISQANKEVQFYIASALYVLYRLLKQLPVAQAGGTGQRSFQRATKGKTLMPFKRTRLRQSHLHHVKNN
jgi:hypothetical protein